MRPLRRLSLILLCGIPAACSQPRVSITDYPVDLRRPVLEQRELQRSWAPGPAGVTETPLPAEVAPAAEPAPAPVPEQAPERTAEVPLNLGSAGSNSAARLGVPQFDRSDAGGGDVDCGDFDSSEEAQRRFLTDGGPENDPNGLDRDGDGFACEWGME